MATINSIPKSIHLPLTTSLSSAPRVLMCSASVGTDASVTLQLRDVNSNDSIQSIQSSSEAAAAAATIITSSTNTYHTTGSAATTSTGTSTTATATTLDNALTIGYPDPEMLADVLGTLQTASLKNTNPSGESTKQNSFKQTTNTSDISSTSLSGTIKNRLTISKRTSNVVNNSPLNTASNNNYNNNNNIINNSNSSSSNNNCLRDISKTTTTSAVQTVSTSTNTTTVVNKTNSYIKNCLIRSSSCSNTTNITSLAQIMSNSNNSSTSNNNSNNNNSHNNNNNGNQINNNNSAINSNNNNNNQNTNTNSNYNLSQLNNNNHTNNSSNNSCNSNFSSSSNDSCFSYSSNSSSGNSVARSVTSLSHGSRKVPGPLTTNPPKILKKSRSKISSPSRHGPQQCQICSKIFGNASALAKHKLTHSDERKYVCVMCSKAFKRQDHLNGHMMTHRNKKPYECKAEGCGKSYCDARSLRRHTENHHAGIISPNNQQLTITNNNSNSNLSLSPATANGDASSPDGATCLGTYLSNGGTVVDAATGLALTEEELKALNVPLKTGVTLLSPTSTTSSMSSSSSMSNGPGATITLTDNSGNLDGEGLTREQLDLISKIMRQTKQTTAQVTVSSPTSSQSYKIDTNPQATVQTQTQNSRSRTWNMQLLNSSQNVAITVDEVNADSGNDSSVKTQANIKEEEIEIDLSNAINSNLFNLVKIDQKPVECNLCHRKFKNVPALNGHMRLHGGYFKKDPETKKNEKKENNGPPLQTASIGVRALIEEKIISKRSKDLNKGAFVVPAPPTISTQNNTTTLRRSVSDLDSFLNPKTQANSTATATQQNSTQQQQQQQLPAVTTIKTNAKSNINMQEINLPQSIEIFSTKQQQQQQQQQQHHQQQKTMNNIGVGTTSNSLNAERSATKTTTSTAATINTTTSRSTSTDPKDSTLIELLKRGTRIAVAQKQPNNSNTPLGGVTRQIITNKNNCSVIIPSEVQVVATKGKLKKDENMQISSATNVTLADGTPLSLTIAQGADSNSEVYTVTYTSDASSLFGENEVYNVSEAEMLLQTVDTMQLLNSAGDNLKSEHSEQYEIMDNKIKLELDQQTCVDQQQQQQQQQQHQQTMPNLNQCQTTQTLPNFQHFHSKELIIQNQALITNHQQIRNNTLSLPQDMKNQFASSLSSPIHSPLAYPTPPSSHENVTQTSPYIEDNHHFNDTQNIFFSESLMACNNSGETENDKIMKLKTVLEDNSFDSNIKVEDLLNDTDQDAECDLREFAEANLSFLDEDQEFLNDSRNATSPLSESFFTSGIGTAEEVKEVLREVLTEDQLNMNCENQGENIIDLYYLPGLSLQSQMMPNSEDPLLSSSPRDFSQQQKIQNAMQPQQAQQQNASQQAQQQQQIQHIPQQQQQQQHNLSQQHNIQYTSQQQQQQQQHHQLQPQQTQTLKISVDSNAQTSATASSDINQLILNVPSNIIHNSCNPNPATSSSTSSSSTTATAALHYNVQNMTQVQNQLNNIQQQQQQEQQHQQQSHIQQQQQQTQFLTSTNVNSLNEALMQPIIYTSGTTDKMELKLENNPNNSTNPQMQNIINLNKPREVVRNTLTNHVTFPQQQHFSNSNNASTNSLQPLSNQTNSILKRRLKGHSFLDSSSSHSYSKYQALTPYKSRLRKPSRTHFTPSPILNPERKGHGLYCNVLKQLGCSLLSFDTFDDDFDDPVGLVDFSDDSKVNLGSAYQATIPAFNGSSGSSSAIEETIGCDLLWDPEVQKDEKILMRFIDLSKSSAVPLGSHSEEFALQALLKAQGNTATAVLTLLQTQSNSFQIKWSSPELEIFLKGLEKYGKEFSKISKELGSKSTGECVQMYYFWKKLCVDYKVTHLKTELPPQNHASDPKPYVCEIPDCSASIQ